MNARTYVLNPTQETVVVDLIHKDGSTDHIFVQPGGKPYLPEGYTVDPNCQRRNPRIRIIQQPSVAAPVPAPAPDTTSN